MIIPKSEHCKIPRPWSRNSEESEENVTGIMQMDWTNQESIDLQESGRICHNRDARGCHGFDILANRFSAGRE